MKQLVVRHEAEIDLANAVRWYEAQRSGLGEQFLSEIERVFILIQNAPERHPLYYRSFRRLLTRRFPYKVFYRVEGEVLVIFRVLHAKQDHHPRL